MHGHETEHKTVRSIVHADREAMLGMADVKPGSHVLDVAAGAGDQTLQVAKRTGKEGTVLATNISSKILEFAALNARKAGYTNVQTRVMDG